MRASLRIDRVEQMLHLATILLDRGAASNAESDSSWNSAEHMRIPDGQYTDKRVFAHQLGYTVSRNSVMFRVTELFMIEPRMRGVGGSAASASAGLSVWLTDNMRISVYALIVSDQRYRRDASAFDYPYSSCYHRAHNAPGETYGRDRILRSRMAQTAWRSAPLSDHHQYCDQREACHEHRQGRGPFPSQHIGPL